MRTGERQDGTGPASLQIRLLGTPEFSLHGARLAGLSSGKAQALLYYLVVSAGPHTRAALATLLWGDLSDSAARTNLRKALHHLRSSLEGYLTIERDSVALSPDADCWVDVVEFDAALQDGTESSLQRAMDLYRGDFSEGFYVRDALDFEGWWLSERARLRELMLASLHGLADQRARLGDLQGAIALPPRFLVLEPWRENAHRRQMRWLALNGQCSAALAQFVVCRQVLEDELAVEPAGLPFTTAAINTALVIAPPSAALHLPEGSSASRAIWVNRFFHSFPPLSYSASCEVLPYNPTQDGQLARTASVDCDQLYE